MFLIIHNIEQFIAMLRHDLKSTIMMNNMSPSECF